MKGLFIHDTEADGLLDTVTKIHCSLFKEHGKDNFILFLDKDHDEYESAKDFALGQYPNMRVLDLSEMKNWMVTEPRALACHNSFGYDHKLWKKMLGIDYDMFEDEGCRGTICGKQVDLYDTLSMSRHLYPDRPLPDGCPTSVKNPVTNKSKRVSPHGLECWGYRVANKKVQIDDWRNQPLWTYVHRVIEDVIINERVWDYLVAESQLKIPEGDSFFGYSKERGGLSSYNQINFKNCLRRGLLSDFLMEEQAEQGVCFDRELAIKTKDKIDQMMKEIEDFVEPLLPMKELSESEKPNFPANPFLADGSISNHGYRWLENHLGYTLNKEFFEFVKPPSKPFKRDGSLSSTGVKFAISLGLSEDDPDFTEKATAVINEQKEKELTLTPLPSEQMELAIKDLQERRMPEMTKKIQLGNQDDVKEFLLQSGWMPTIFNAKNLTINAEKKNRSDEEVDELIYKYMDMLESSPFKINLLRELEVGRNTYEDKEKFFKFLKKKARGLPTTPQLKDKIGLCPNLEKVNGDLAKNIVLWLSLRNRRTTLLPLKEDNTETGWLNNPRLDIDGKLTPSYSGITNTRRRKHSVVVNVPKAEESVLLGKEFRSLFTAPEGHVLIGCDGSNLEGMIAAWGAFPFDNGEYAEIMESGDNHTRMARSYSEAAMREVSRNDGKGISYGIMYGGQAIKIASMLGVSQEIGQRVIDAYWDSNIGLKGRREWLESFWTATGKRFIPAIDGSKIYTRSKHSLLNAYQQNGGASLFDLVGILFHREIKRRGWYDKGVRRVLYVHDEIQVQAPKEFITKTYNFDSKTKDEFAVEFKEWQENNIKNGKEIIIAKPKFNKDEGRFVGLYSPVGDLMVRCVRQSAKMLGSPVKIDGEYIIGKNWAETH